MIKSYLKTAFRFLLKNKTFSFINIFGLAAGTLCCLYMLLYVQDQYSYDEQHKGVENIYRVTTRLVLTGDKHNMATSSPSALMDGRSAFMTSLAAASVVSRFSVIANLPSL